MYGLNARGFTTLLAILGLSLATLFVLLAHQPRKIAEGSTTGTASWHVNVPYGSVALAEGYIVIVDGKKTPGVATVPNGEHELTITNGGFRIVDLLHQQQIGATPVAKEELRVASEDDLLQIATDKLCPGLRKADVIVVGPGGYLGMVINPLNGNRQANGDGIIATLHPRKPTAYCVGMHGDMFVARPIPGEVPPEWLPMATPEPFI